MRINHNMLAINTHRQMGATGVNQSKSMEKLSSGLRINRAGDDAAGLAISEKMRAQVRGLNQASRNAQDGISMIQTAEGALNETQNILQRMRELAVQSTNDTNNDKDRAALQNEIDQLTDEIDRIAKNTEFNNKKLLNGDLGKARAAQASIAEGTANYLASKSSANAALTGVSGDFTDAAFKGQEVGEHVFTFTDGVQSVTTSSLSNLDGTETLADLGVTSLGAFTVEADSTGATGAINIGSSLSLTSTVADVVAELNNAAGVSAELNDKGQIEVYKTTVAGANETVQLADVTGDAVATLFGAGTKTGNASVAAAGNHYTVTDTYTDASGNVTTKTFRGVDFNASTADADVTFKGITFEVGTGNLAAANSVVVEGLEAQDALAARTDGSLAMQIGANENQQMDVDVEDMSASALGVRVGGNSIDISTSDAAARAITKFNEAIETVSGERAKLGAVQNRLEHTIANLDTSSENLQASESRIRDVDMAKEMMELTKNNILQQAAQSMLAQANQAPQGVLQLLR